MSTRYDIDRYFTGHPYLKPLLAEPQAQVTDVGEHVVAESLFGTQAVRRRVPKGSMAIHERIFLLSKDGSLLTEVTETLETVRPDATVTRHGGETVDEARLRLPDPDAVHMIARIERRGDRLIVSLHKPALNHTLKAWRESLAKRGRASSPNLRATGS